MQTELISVIIPVYNVEKYLARCIDSVINQTYKNIEIILVNDGSTDKSGKLCDEYIKKDSRVVVIHKENGGAAAARNKGLDIAKGGWISFVDSDDFVAVDFLDVLYSDAVENKVLISCCRLINTYESYLDFDKINQNLPEDKILSGTDACKHLHTQKELLITQTLVNRLYSYSIFEKFRLPEGNMCEDEAVIYKLLYNCDRVLTSYKYLYAYYQTQSSVMRDSFSKRHLIYLSILEERLSYYKDKNEKELYELTIKNKCYALQDYYCKCKRKYPEEQALYMGMRKQFCELFPIAIKAKAIPIKSKLSLIIMRIVPLIYEKVKG